jgi:multicomponent Na+:H+ antiporter subunit E
MPPHHFLRPVAVVQFALFFLRNSIVSGVQVARLALDPRCHPQPHCVDVVLSLPEGPPRLIVAGALGLMPGTLSVRLDGAALHVHAIDAGIPVAAEAAALEAQVARMIGIEYGKMS